MPPIVELILYYVPVTLVASFVYASVKRHEMNEIVRAAVRYFVVFTGLMVALVVLLEVVPLLFGG